jgi:hypothetical protein
MGVSVTTKERSNVFQFEELDGMSRLILLKKQKETIEYWRQVYRLKSAFSAWSSQTMLLINEYKAAGGVSDLTKALDAVAIKGEITLRRLHNQIEKVDQYLKDIDVRLSDGTRWYSALEIQEMADELKDEDTDD